MEEPTRVYVYQLAVRILPRSKQITKDLQLVETCTGQLKIQKISTSHCLCFFPGKEQTQTDHGMPILYLLEITMRKEAHIL